MPKTENGNSSLAVSAQGENQEGGREGFGIDSTQSKPVECVVRLDSYKVRNILTYLERLVLPVIENGKPLPSRLKTKIIESDVLSLMSEITRQTGINLDGEEIKTGPAVSDIACNNHIRTARGTCAICATILK